MNRKDDLAQLAHLLRVCARTTSTIATVETSADMIRLSELARRVEAIADEMDDLQDEDGPRPDDNAPPVIGRRRQ